ncbi:unnamed protein product [Ixodes pacificus]
MTLALAGHLRADDLNGTTHLSSHVVVVQVDQGPGIGRGAGRPQVPGVHEALGEGDAVGHVV